LIPCSSVFAYIDGFHGRPSRAAKYKESLINND
jgi:hypothetical protein